MPNLGRLVPKAPSGHLKTLSPPLSPLIWTTMMTGQQPARARHPRLRAVRSGHRQEGTDYQQRAPRARALEHGDRGRQRVLRCSACGRRSRPRRSTAVVSDRLFTFLYKEVAAAARCGLSGGPRSLGARRPGAPERDVDFAALHAYLPWLTEAEYAKVADSDDPYAQPVSALRRMLVETPVYERSACSGAASAPDLAIVYLQSTDTIGHVFAPYAPPKQAESRRGLRALQRRARAFLPRVDRALGEYRTPPATAGAVLMLASDHGFFWGDGRPTKLSSVAPRHRRQVAPQQGMYLLWGKGIAAEPGHDAQGDVRRWRPPCSRSPGFRRAAAER